MEIYSGPMFTPAGPQCRRPLVANEVDVDPARRLDETVNIVGHSTHGLHWLARCRRDNAVAIARAGIFLIGFVGAQVNGSYAQEVMSWCGALLLVLCTVDLTQDVGT